MRERKYLTYRNVDVSGWLLTPAQIAANKAKREAEEAAKLAKEEAFQKEK